MVSDKEERFKNLSVKDKVNNVTTLIIIMYLGSMIFASVMLMVMRKLPIEYELAFGIITIVVLAVIAFNCVRVTSKRAKWLVKYIAEPIGELSQVAEDISNGRLDVEVAYEAQDEIGQLAKDFKKTAVTLHKIIADLSNILEAFAQGDYTIHSECKEAYVGAFQIVMDKLMATVTNISSTLHLIRDASDEVAAGAGQLVVSSQDLAKGAEEQSIAVDNLVASVTEVANQVIANSKSTDIVHDKAKEVGAEAVISQNKMKELMQAMESISKTSQEIEKVIVEIESIASQTNLLALNASIEAARAGEAGKGFAVVAEQIRMLAESSADSAETSKHLLEVNRTEVTHGNDVTQKTADSLNKVLAELDHIIGEVANIRTASDNQAVSVKQIEEGVKQISDVIQSNSAASEEASATSEELSAEADSLDSLVGRFKLRDVK